MIATSARGSSKEKKSGSNKIDDVLKQKNVLSVKYIHLHSSLHVRAHKNLTWKYDGTLLFQKANLQDFTRKSVGRSVAMYDSPSSISIDNTLDAAIDTDLLNVIRNAGGIAPHYIIVSHNYWSTPLVACLCNILFILLHMCIHVCTVKYLLLQ